MAIISMPFSPPPVRKDGLYWPAAPGQPQSPLGAQVAHSQPDGRFPGDHYGYNFRLLLRWFEKLLRALLLFLCRGLSSPHFA